MTSAFPYTTDFRREFEAEHERWLRTRFLWYTGVVVVIKVAFLVLGIAGRFVIGRLQQGGTPPALISPANIALSIAGICIFAAAFAASYRQEMTKREVLSMAFWLILASGVVSIVGALLELRSAGTSERALVGVSSVLGLFYTHIFACCFLPWSWRESIRPLVPLLILNAVVTIITAYDSPWIAIGIIAASPVIGVPGAAVCWWRYSRFRDRVATAALRGRYAEIRRELVDARRIHEALFPAPVEHGPVRFRYVYEPMRQLGGDYLYARFVPSPHGPEPAFNLLLFDVTGHGIAAALTVNRLHGESERLFGEDPYAGPGEVLGSLNRYVHLTLAGHSVYVTALCFRIDPNRDTLEYASGGHPPAFVCTADGRLEQLDSTALVLGAAAAKDFETEVHRQHFGPGDTLVAFTDGALEARNGLGRHLGVVGLQRLLASLKVPRESDCIRTILAAVARHRAGAPEDDVLVVEVHRPVGTIKTDNAAIRASVDANA